jgi:hypothetical protein
MYRVLRPGGLVLLTFHVGTEVRHFDAWLGHDVDVDFRFHEPRDVVAALEDTGFTLQAQLERRAYPAEVDTRRAYLLAARPAYRQSRPVTPAAAGRPPRPPGTPG